MVWRNAWWEVVGEDGSSGHDCRWDCFDARGCGVESADRKVPLAMQLASRKYIYGVSSLSADLAWAMWRDGGQASHDRHVVPRRPPWAGWLRGWAWHRKPCGGGPH